MTDETLGAYQRHEKHDAADFAHAHFAMHPVTGSVASKGRMDWKWVLPGWYNTGDPSRLSDQKMADAGWSPVRECPDPDEHVRYDAALAAAEKAERERDEARATKDMHKRRADEERARAEAAESRPLTPDTMTAREYLDAAWEAAYVPADGIIPEGCMFLDRGTAGVVVVGAAGKDLASRGSSWERRLVDPPAPARPEGAEELGELIGTWTASEDIAPAQLPTGSLATLADFLAQRGVRVVGGEDPR